MDGAPDVLGACLRPLQRWLEADDVENIEICNPGELSVARRGAVREFHAVQALDAKALKMLAQLIATGTNQVISPATPTLAAWLPNGDRVQIMMPPAVPEGRFSLVIRRKHFRLFTLEKLRETGFFDGTRVRPLERSRATSLSAEARRLAEAGDAAAFLRLAVLEKRSVVVTGIPNSGKTTLMNALLLTIPHTDSVATIEDVREIELPHVKMWHSLVSSYGDQGVARLSIHEQLANALRLSVDRVLLNELRGQSAWTFLQAMNTGEVGCMTSLHSTTAEDGFVRLADMALEGAPKGIPQESVREHARSFVDVWVGTRLEQGRRYVAEVLYA